MESLPMEHSFRTYGMRSSRRRHVRPVVMFRTAGLRAGFPFSFFFPCCGGRVMSSSLRVFLGVCLLVALLAGSVFVFRPDLFEGTADAAEAPQRPVMVVRVQSPRQQVLPVRLPADGEVVAWEEASVASESNSLTLAEVLVNAGDVVKKGQVLARFNGRTVASDVTQARAALVEAQAAAGEARANARRARRLKGTDSLSEQQIEQYLSAERSALAKVRSARAALASRRQNWQNVELRAPDDGVISSRTATVGSVPAAGTELFRLIRQGRLEWHAELGTSDVLKIHPGSLVRIMTADGSVAEGKVRARAPSENTKTRTTLVYVDVPASPGLWAGMFASGSFELGEREGLTVPMEALVPADGFMHVFRMRDDGHVERVRVQVGRQTGTEVEILPALKSSLSQADRVVVEGAAFLSDGDLVKVADSAQDRTADNLDAGPGDRTENRSEGSRTNPGSGAEAGSGDGAENRAEAGAAGSREARSASRAGGATE